MQKNNSIDQRVAAQDAEALLAADQLSPVVQRQSLQNFSKNELSQALGQNTKVASYKIKMKNRAEGVRHSIDITKLKSNSKGLKAPNQLVGEQRSKAMSYDNQA